MYFCDMFKFEYNIPNIFCPLAIGQSAPYFLSQGNEFIPRFCNSFSWNIHKGNKIQALTKTMDQKTIRVWWFHEVIRFLSSESLIPEGI